MSLSEWINVLIALLAPIIGAIGAIISKIVIDRMQPTKQMTYEVTSNIRGRVESQIDATINGQSINNAQLISLRVKNTGKKPIEEKDYLPRTQIGFGFGTEAKVLAAKVAQTASSTNARDTSVTIDSGKVLLAPLRLESPESVTLNILVADFNDEIMVETPQFSGDSIQVKQIVKASPRKSPIPRNILITFIISVIIAFLLFNFIISFIYEYFYNKNFPIYFSNIFYLSEYVVSLIAAIMISIIHIASNYLSPLEVTIEHPSLHQAILKMDKPKQLVPAIYRVWTICAFLITSPLIYYLAFLYLEHYIDAYIYRVLYLDSYVEAFTNSAFWGSLITTIVMIFITNFAMNEYLHKRSLPLKIPVNNPYDLLGIQHET